MKIFIICENDVTARRAMSSRQHLRNEGDELLYVRSAGQLEGVKVNLDDRVVLVGIGSKVREMYEALVRVGLRSNVRVTELFTSRIWP